MPQVLFHKHVLLLTNLITSPFFPSRVWSNLSSYSIVYVVPLSLVSLSASPCSSLSCCILKWVEILMVEGVKTFFCWLLTLKHLLLILFLIQFLIISLLQYLIQLFFKCFCRALQCIALDINYSYCFIFNFYLISYPLIYVFKSIWAFLPSEKLFYQSTSCKYHVSIWSYINPATYQLHLT